jgi:hypothetical protein
LPTEAVPTKTPEAAPSPVELTPQPGSVAPAQATVPPTQASPTAPPAQTVHTGSTQGRALFDPNLASMDAADEDLIEKEWVDKAEEVITNDQDNPYVEDQHQHEMNKLYLKKRFNLDVS